MRIVRAVAALLVVTSGSKTIAQEHLESKAEAKQAILDLYGPLGQQRQPIAVAERYTPEELWGASQELIHDRPDFAPGTSGRAALSQVLLMSLSLHGDRGMTRSSIGDIVLNELREGTEENRIIILEHEQLLKGPYENEICVIVSTMIEEARSVQAIQTGLDASLALCERIPERLVPVLMSLILEPEVRLAEIEGGPPNEGTIAWVSSEAARALLEGTCNPSMLESLARQTDSHAARRAIRGALLFGVMAEEGCYLSLGAFAQREWILSTLSVCDIAGGIETMSMSEVMSFGIYAQSLPEQRKLVRDYLERARQRILPEEKAVIVGELLNSLDFFEAHDSP